MPDDARLCVATSNVDLTVHAQAWRDLEARCRVAPTVFQSWTWIKAWLDAQDPESSKPLILLGYRNDRLVFALPLQFEREAGVTVLHSLSYPMGQYGDALCDAQEDVAAWMEAGLAHVKNLKVADCLRFRHVRAESNIAAYLKGHFHDGKFNETAPAMDLTSYPTPEAFDARYNITQRHRRKRIRKRLEELGEVVFETLSSEASQQRDIGAILAEKLKWLDEHAHFNQALRTDSAVKFFKILAAQPDFQSIVRVTVAGQPMAWGLGYRYRGKHYHFLTAHKQGTTELSAGRLLTDYAVKDAIKSGVTEFDMLPPLLAHKETYSTREMPVNDYFMPLTNLGAIYGHAYLALVRPLLRKIYLNMPERLRRALLLIV